MFFVYIFDSGKLDTSYGDVVFSSMLKNDEISNNTKKVIISIGDILINTRHVDIEPYVIHDKWCTIDLKKLNGNNDFIDYPFCWAIEDLDEDIAKKLDQRLKDELNGYIGLSRIDPSLTDPRKQFWRSLIRSFSIYKKTITCFHDPEVTDIFCYNELAQKLNFEVVYAADAELCPVEDNPLLQSSSILSEDDLRQKPFNPKTDKANGVDRDIMLLNFSLCKELEIAGAFIWKSIIELDKIHFQSADEKMIWDSSDTFLEYPFLTLYFSAQGIERLQKIIVELIIKLNHFKDDERNKPYELLMSHRHVALHDWIKNQISTPLSGSYGKLISIVETFYNKLRYGRYIDIPQEKKSEYELLYSFKGDTTESFDLSIKNTFGKNIGGLAKAYYDLIYDISSKLNIYVYELQNGSASVFVFSGNDKKPNLYQTYLQIKQSKKEALYWLLKAGSAFPKYPWASSDPLGFDPEMMDTYLEEIINNPEIPQMLFDETDALFDELHSENSTEWQEHIEAVDAIIANTSVQFFTDENDEDDDSN